MEIGNPSSLSPALQASSPPLITEAPAPTDAPVTSPLAAWFARLGVSGKILCIAALVGIIATLLPWATISMEMPAVKGFGKSAPAMNLGVSTSQSRMVLDDFRGKIELLGFIAALVLGILLYPANGRPQKSLCYAALGVGGLTLLLSLWMLVAVINSSSDLGFMGASLKITPGIGAFLACSPPAAWLLVLF